MEVASAIASPEELTSELRQQLAYERVNFDRWCDERVTGRLQAVIDSCQQLAREAVKGDGGEATAAATTTDCIELLPLARSLQRSLADADGRPASRIVASETVFHWEVG